MANKKAAVKKASKKQPPAKKTKKKVDKVQSITFFSGGERGRVVRDGGPHDFIIVGTSHSLVIPKDQKLAKIKIAKTNSDIKLAFDK